MERVILHSDANGFYASVECLRHPELRDKPMVVGGDIQARHGIVLAKNPLAKQWGIRTGQVLWQARQSCPGLVIQPPDYPQYLRFSRLLQNIYLTYTDRVEPFGLDECWLDVTGCNGEALAQEIRQRVKAELGITVSIGVSFNKIFAKLGSDYKKPDAVTLITRENFQNLVWPLPAGDLLYVGPATRRKLEGLCITTIGQLACAPPDALRARLGKMGEVLYCFANGYDSAPVARYTDQPPVKSVGNSATTVRDLKDDEDVKQVLAVLCDSVGRRLREQGLRGRGISVSVRDCRLSSASFQCTLEQATDLTAEITGRAFQLFRAHYHWHSPGVLPLRSIGVHVFDLSCGEQAVQLDCLGKAARQEREKRLEAATDQLKRRFGSACVRPASLLIDPRLTGFDPKAEHVIHPVGYF